MKTCLRVLPLMGTLMLSGCFMTLEPRIEVASLLSEGPAVFCTPGDDPCLTAEVENDGYVLRTQTVDEEEMYLRFEPLAEAGGLMIYLGEAELQEEEQSVWTFILARQSGLTEDGLPRFDVQMPGCNDMSAEQGILYSIERADSYSCLVSDIGKFRNFLIDTYSERFADPEWWITEN